MAQFNDQVEVAAQRPDYRHTAVLFGLERQQDIIEVMIQRLALPDSDVFDVRLILTEAVTNAHIHGNGCDPFKPIGITCERSGDCLHMEIEDAGQGFEPGEIPAVLDDSKLLDESGRGLFLIQCLSDEVRAHHNRLVILKTLNKE